MLGITGKKCQKNEAGKGARKGHVIGGSKPQASRPNGNLEKILKKELKEQEDILLQLSEK